MARGKRDGADVKQMHLQLDLEIYEELCRRSKIEGKSLSDVVQEALRAHLSAVRVTKAHLHAAIERIAREDTDILEALGRGHRN